MHSENIFMKRIWSKAHDLYRQFPFIRCLAPQTPSPIFSNVFFSWNMKLTGTYNRFNNYLLCITLKGREILISKGWLGVGMVGEDISPNLPPSADSFICSVDSTYFVRNHVVWMIGCTEFRAGIRTKSNRTYHTFLNTQPIFIKQVHRPPNYSKQTFISKSLHDMPQLPHPSYLHLTNEWGWGR